MLREIMGADSTSLPDLTDAVLNIAGFSEACRTNELYKAYEVMMNKHVALLDGDDDVLIKIAAKVLVELQGLKW